MRSPRGTIWFLYAVITLALFLFLFGLGGPAFVDNDESAYAEIIHETAASHAPWVLTFRGENFFDKPPLYFWVAAATSKILPGPEFAYRFPSALAGILSVLLAMLICLEITKNYSTAALAGLILAVTPAFLESSRQARLDAPVTLAILFAFYCFLRGLREPRWLFGIGIFIGIGVLTKSIIGFLAIPIIIVYALSYWQFGWLRSKYLWLGILLGLAIALPWHWFEYVRFGPEFWNKYVMHTIFQRFSEDVNPGTSVSFLGYFSYFLQFCAPWSVLFILLLGKLVYQRKADEEVKPTYVFAGLSVLLIIVFAFSSTRVIYYLVPAYPFMAICLALVSAPLVRKLRASTATSIIILIIFSGALVHTIFVGFHAYTAFKEVSVLADDQRVIGRYLSLHSNPDTVYEYKFAFWDALYFYSGGRRVYLMKEDQLLDRPFFLIMPTQFFYQPPFPVELQRHFTLRYRGTLLTLMEFSL